MRAVSFSTLIVDPYRAGLALGESLVALSPEVVFLFSSKHFSNPELLEGLYDALERDDVIVVGNSGDGFYETVGASDYGAAVLGLNSGGTVRWQLEQIAGLDVGLDLKFEQMMRRLSATGETPCLGFLVSDFRVEGGRIDALLRQWVKFPTVGGLATDDHRQVCCALYVNREVISDALFFLAAYGDLHFTIALENTQRAVGRAGLVEISEATEIHRIDGRSAIAFVERETGKPLLHTDRGVLSVQVSDPEAPDEKRLRAIFEDFSEHSGSIHLFGGIDQGHSVQICLASPEDMVAKVQQVAENEYARGRRPVAALIVSCSGRKALLGTLIEHEISALTRIFSPDLPLAGFPSAGEIGPLRRGNAYTRNLFHNMTYVLLLIED